MRDLLSRGKRVVVLVVAIAGLLGVPVAGSPAAPEGPAYDLRHILVMFEETTSAAARSAVHASVGGVAVNHMGWLDLDVVLVPEGTDPNDLVAEYERIDAVKSASLNWKVQASSIPDDSLFEDQWGFHNTGQTGGTVDADIDAPEGWTAAFGDGTFENTGGTIVGVLDTGIDSLHEDLQGEVVACANALLAIGAVIEGYCQDDNGHGTHVAGTVSATTGNGIGVAGTAPSAQLAVFKGLDATGSGFFGDIIAGIHWLHAEAGAQVINMSFGAPESSEELDAELSEAFASGTLLVASAGNEEGQDDRVQSHPAFHPDVVSVAATDHSDAHADFSNCNSDVEVAAPGVDIWSTFVGSVLYASIDGTSMASPHAAGVAAMIMSELGLDNVQTRSRLSSTADDLGPPGRDTCFGSGRVNLSTALGGASTLQSTAVAREPEPSPSQTAP